MKKILYIILGCIGVGLGAVGAVVPMLPAFPFLMLAAFCFGRSSKKLDTWFKGTNLYKKNLESFVQGRGMTKKTKLRIIATVTALMAVGFIMMRNVPVGRICLAAVWVFHVIYFIFGIRTIAECHYCRSMQVGGIHCKNCIHHLKQAMAAAGMSATVDCETGTVTVYSPTESDPDHLIRLVESAGFTAGQVGESKNICA